MTHPGAFDEAAHPRGKTTAASSGGSFAPKSGGEESPAPKKTEIEQLDAALFGEFESAPDRAAMRIAAKERVAQALGADLVAGKFTRAQLDQTATMLFGGLLDKSGKPFLNVSSITAGMSDEKLCEKIAGRIVDSWAATSGDSSQLAIALQHAVENEFHVEGAQSGHLVSKGTGGLEPLANDPVIRTAMRAEYTHTQAWLKERGITELTLVRGMRLESNRTTLTEPIDDTIELQPASSFTTDLHVALGFADYIPGSTVVGIRVPAARILATPWTGRGCLPEHEVLVLGGKYRGRIISTRHPGAAAGSESGQRYVWDWLNNALA